MPRTTPDLVAAVLCNDFGPKADGTLPDLTPYIDTASSIVDDAVPIAARFGSPWNAAKQELIERWLSAWCYCVMDPTYMSKGQGGANASYQRVGATDDFGSNEYGRTAVRLDPSGALTALGKRQVARGFWIGQKHGHRNPIGGS